MKRAFTLIETLVAVSVGLLIFLTVLALFSMSRTAFSALGDRAELTQNSRIVLERAVRDLRQAARLATRLPATQIEFQDGHDTSTINYIRYFVQNGGLYRETSFYAFPAAPAVHVLHDELDGQGNLPQKTVVTSELTAEYISALNVSQPENRMLLISVTAAKGQTSLPSTTTIYARNLP